jgi:hypothetical protein
LSRDQIDEKLRELEKGTSLPLQPLMKAELPDKSLQEPPLPEIVDLLKSVSRRAVPKLEVFYENFRNTMEKLKNRRIKAVKKQIQLVWGTPVLPSFPTLNLIASGFPRPVKFAELSKTG